MIKADFFKDLWPAVFVKSYSSSALHLENKSSNPGYEARMSRNQKKTITFGYIEQGFFSQQIPEKFFNQKFVSASRKQIWFISALSVPIQNLELFRASVGFFCLFWAIALICQSEITGFTNPLHRGRNEL